MITREFTIEIAAPAQHVWFALWDGVMYSQWTSAFCQGSYYSGNLKIGERIHFLSPGGEGMYSTVSHFEVNKQLHFSHMGEIKNFVEMPLDEESKSWSGAREHYDITEKDGICTLLVTLDLVEKHADYFDQAFPKGLALLKQQAEHLQITVSTLVNDSLQKTWDCFTLPKHVMQWNQASADWHCPYAENDLRVGGQFLSRMAAKDGSFSFDFKGTYEVVVQHEKFEYVLEDGRKVSVQFEPLGEQTRVTEILDPENQNSLDLQKAGWQCILDSFKLHTEKVSEQESLA